MLVMKVNHDNLSTLRGSDVTYSETSILIYMGRTCNTCTLHTHDISKAGPATCIAMASVGEAVCVLEGVVRGHYIYMYKATWAVSNTLSSEIKRAISGSL